MRSDDASRGRLRDVERLQREPRERRRIELAARDATVGLDDARAGRDEIGERAFGGEDLEHLARGRREEELDAEGKPLEKTEAIHNARLFLGFSDKIYKGVEFAASVEYLQDLIDGNTFRFIFDGAIKAAIAPHFALATGVNVHYENNPLPGVVNTDVIGAVSLVYNMF